MRLHVHGWVGRHETNFTLNNVFLHFMFKKLFIKLQESKNSEQSAEKKVNIEQKTQIYQKQLFC